MNPTEQLADLTARLKQAEAERDAAQDKKRESLAEQAYLKLQRDRLLEITWLDLPDEPHESTTRWAEEFDKGWIRREPAEQQLAAAIAKLAAVEEERDEAKTANELWEETMQEEVAINMRIAEHIGIAEIIKGGIAYEDAEIARFDQLTAERDALQYRLADVEAGAAKMREIGGRIKTQDNRCTAAPMFCVQIKVRDVGYDANYADSPCWYHADSGDVRYTNPGALKGWEKFGYKDRWETVMVAFTEKGCEEYLAINGHNDRSRAHNGEVRIYVESFRRCPEMLTIRDALMALSTTAGTELLEDLKTLRTALEQYADPGNWHVGSKYDGESRSFTGPEEARKALDETEQVPNPETPPSLND